MARADDFLAFARTAGQVAAVGTATMRRVVGSPDQASVCCRTDGEHGVVYKLSALLLIRFRGALQGMPFVFCGIAQGV